MNYTGTARRLQANDVAEAAASIGVTEAHIRTVMEVETLGHGFDAYGHPIILFERHRFYAELGKGSKRTTAVKQGLAYPRQGAKPYPKTEALRWSEFERACQIDETAAIRSTSWGLGQIMGNNFKEAGYASAEEMVEAFCESEREQLFGMAKLIQGRGLNKVMLSFPSMAACRKFARSYNGKGYKRNQYDTKLHDAFVRWNTRMKSNAPMHDDGVLRVGSRGTRVKAMQQQLNDLGYSLKVDDVYGTRTRDMVLAWQADNHRSTTGEMSAMDLSVLDKSPHRPVAEERAVATSKDLAPNSSIVRNSNVAGNVLKGATALMGGATVADQSGMLDNAQGIVDHVQQANGIFGQVQEIMQSTGIKTLLRFVLDHQVFIFIGVALIVWFVVHRIRKARVDMHNKGEIA